MKNPQLTTYSMVKAFPLELEAMPTFATSSQYYIRGSRWHNGKTNLTSSFQNVLNLLSVFLICCQNGPDFRGNSVQFSHSVVSDSLRPHGLQDTRPPVHHQHPGFTQTHVRWVSDDIQPSHPLSSPSPAFNLSQHQGLSKWVSSSHQVAKILEFQLQHQFFQRIFRTDLLWDGLVGSPCSPRDSQESSLAPQFKRTNSLAFSFLYSPTLTSIQYLGNFNFKTDYVFNCI